MIVKRKKLLGMIIDVVVKETDMRIQIGFTYSLLYLGDGYNALEKESQ